MLNVWKDLFIGKVFGKTFLSSKSLSGNVESRSDSSPDVFPPKIRFFHKILKKNPTPRPPRSEKNYQTEHLSRNFFLGEAYKDRWRHNFDNLFLKFKKHRRVSRKCLEDKDSTKKDRWPKKTVQIFTIQLWQSCWNFPKIVRIFALKLHEQIAQFPKKFIQLLKTFQVKKSPWNICSRQIKRIFDNRLKLCCRSMTISAQILEKIRKQIFDRRKISSIISSGHREAFLINLQKNDKKLKLCWMFEKLYLSEKFLEIHVFPQKVPLEALSHVLITLLTIFAKSLFFP